MGPKKKNGLSLKHLGETVLITGGARGLGLIFAELYASRGARVAICSRTSEDVEVALEQLKEHYPHARVAGYVTDVSHEDEVRTLVSNVVRDLGPIDILVNNAGVILSAPFDKTTLGDFRSALDSNLWGMVHATLAVLPAMRARRKGKILNITSLGGVLPVPHLSVYTTSKYAAVGFSTSVALAARDYGVTVTTAIPALIRTGSFLHARFKGDHAREFGLFTRASTSPVFSKSATAAASAMMKACDQGKPYAVIGWSAKFGRILFALFPNLLTRILIAVERRLPHGDGPGAELPLEGHEINAGLKTKPASILGQKAAEKWNERPGV